MKRRVQTIYFPVWVSCILTILVDRIRRGFKVEASNGKPQFSIGKNSQRGGG